MKFSQQLRVLGMLCISSTTLHSNAADRTSPAETMLAFFGSTCVAKDGSYTKAALNKALVLAQTLEGIKDDPDCRAFSAASTQASSIASALNVLETKVSYNKNFANQEQAVLSSMAYATDATQMNLLQDLLVKINVNKQLSDYDVQAIAAKEMVSQTNIFVQQAINNQNCLMKKPGLLSAVGSLISSVGVAATAVNPAIGLGATVGGNMLSNLVNLANQMKLSKQIRKIKDQTLMPEAVTCVMESLTTDYCKANDAITALDWKQSHQDNENYPVSSPAYALRLVDRDIPVFMKWLTSLRVAAKSQNIYDASQVSDFKAKEALYESSPSLASGVIESTNLNPSDSADVKWSVLSRTVRMLVGVLWGTSDRYDGPSKNPLFQVYSEQQALFYLIGFSPSNLPSTQANGPIKFENYNPNSPNPSYTPALPDNGISYDLNAVMNRFNAWFTLTQGLVNAERSRVLKQDSQKILQDAFSEEQTVERISPYLALSNIIKFLNLQKINNPAASETLYFLPDTISRLALIQNKLEATHSPFWSGCTKEDSSELLGEIYKDAELGSGVVFIGDRLRSHADQALIRYLKQTPSPVDQSVLAQTMASTKMTEILLLTNSGKDRGEIRDDIFNSTTIILPAFDNFVKNYQQNIRDVLETLVEQEAQYGPKAGQAYYNKRARICMMLTQAVEWPYGVPFSLCEGTSLSLLIGGPRSEKLLSSDLDKDFTERSCKLHRLKRDTLIYDTRSLFKD